MAKAEKEMKTEKSNKRAKIMKTKKKNKVDLPIPSIIPQEGEKKEQAVNAENEAKIQKSKKRAKITKTKKKEKCDRPIPSTIPQEGEGKNQVVHPAGESGEIELNDDLATDGKRERESNYANKKVVVTGMPYTATEQDIRDFFEKIGIITKMRLTLFPDTGNFRGLAFLTFKTMESATKSLELDGTKMGDRYIKVERCRQDPPKKRKSEFLGEPEQIEGCLSVYIGNLAKNITEDGIRNFFDKSKITSIRLAMNKKTKKSRGFGHIDFKNSKSMEEALKKNQTEFHGKPIKISYAAPNKS